jgi:hypothetical protein
MEGAMRQGLRKRTMTFRTKFRTALLAAGLATVLNPILASVLLVVLDALDLLIHRGGWFSLDTRGEIIIFSLLLAIPEVVLGLLFGYGLASFSKGGRLTGALAGAAIWAAIPALSVGNALLFYKHITVDDPPSLHMLPDGTMGVPPEIKWDAFRDEVVRPLAWLFKELLTGIIVGWVVAGYVAKGKSVLSPE